MHELLAGQQQLLLESLGWLGVTATSSLHFTLKSAGGDEGAPALPGAAACRCGGPSAAPTQGAPPAWAVMRVVYHRLGPRRHDWTSKERSLAGRRVLLPSGHIRGVCDLQVVIIEACSRRASRALKITLAWIPPWSLKITLAWISPGAMPQTQAWVSEFTIGLASEYAIGVGLRIRTVD